MTHEGLEYPTHEDLVGTAEALARLQRTYRLQVKELSAGKINKVVYSSPMSAGDCFELGRGLFKQNLYDQCVSWMKEALDKYHNDSNGDMYPFREVDILEYISFSYYLMENHLHNKIAEEMWMSDWVDRVFYEAHCRGEMEIPIEISVRLKCWYVTENHPFLRLAPLKVEQMYIEPDVFVFHQVISDDEIEFIKENAKPKLRRAMVYDAEEEIIKPINGRISKLAWLRDKESPVIARVSQRVADMTGLTMDSAEDLQVLNYGIGGYYEPHCDFVMNSAFWPHWNKRIATVLFYMSDVAQGGATVFPKLGVTVFPKKNAALFWMNLHPSGEGDLATKHAGCPVLMGSKWVCTKWLHQTGQEFIKPCNLEYQEEGFARQIPRPTRKIRR